MDGIVGAVGMTACAKHGSQGMALTCPHGHVAWQRGVGIEMREFRHEFWGRSEVCLACAPEIPQDMSDEDFEVWIEAVELKPICGRCYAEWRGDLLPPW